MPRRPDDVDVDAEKLLLIAFKRLEQDIKEIRQLSRAAEQQRRKERTRETGTKKRA